MKKLHSFFLVLLLFIFSYNSFAQNSPVEFSVKAGINLSGATIDNKEASPGAKVGYQIGVNVDYIFNNLFFIESGLSFTAKGSKIKNYYAGELIGGGNGRDGDMSTFNQLYVQLPLYAGYKFEITNYTKVSFLVGPYFAYGVGGKSKEELKKSVFGDGSTKREWDTFKEEEYGIDPTLKKFDMGIGFGANVELNRFIIGVGGEYGLLNITSRENSKYKNLNASLIVGYKF